MKQEKNNSQPTEQGEAERIAFNDLANTIAQFVRNNLHREGTLIGVSKVDENWIANVEVVEERRPFDDILATYQIIIDQRMSVVGFGRKGLRRKSDLPKEELGMSEPTY